jgi:CBS domain-containing protein
MTMEKVKELLDVKGRHVATCQQGCALSECAVKMSKEDVGSLLVYDGEKLRGILTWHDLLRALAEHPADVGSRPAGEFMSTDLLTTTESADYADVAQQMVDGHVRHVPVMEGDRVVGIVDRIDVVARQHRQSEDRSGDLEAYIRGTYPA